jgi:general secretion pathway protein D
LATDNEEAQIVVGQNVPFLASTGTNAVNLNNTFNQVDRQDVGITLRITPQISSRDYVTLRVYTEVSALVLSTINSALGPTTTKRQSETTIIAKDGQMIVTGGLIADDVSEGYSSSRSRL